MPYYFYLVISLSIIFIGFAYYYFQIRKKKDIPIQTFYDDSLFPKLEILKKNFKEIQKECLDVYHSCEVTNKIKRKQEEWNGSLDKIQEFIVQHENKYWIPAWTDDWSNYALMLKDCVAPGITSKICPKTTEVLKSIGGINVAGFSLVNKNCKIAPHTDATGPSYGSLSYHLCLVGESLLLVNNTPVLQEPGKTIIFNPEYEHSLYNHTDKDRIILYIDFMV
jgi:aspartyl/asparaginyl beta-hydroxylase (cupin superfamily)